MIIADKVALITGGAHRIGKAITLELARAGAHVIINYHRSSKATALATAAESEALGVRALALQADVTDWKQLKAMLTATKQKLGPVSILVNAASVFRKTPLPADDLSDWQLVTDTLLHGAFLCANAVTPAMQAAGEGVIINIVDLMAWQPRRGFAAHSVGKAALLALTRQLAVDLAPTCHSKDPAGSCPNCFSHDDPNLDPERVPGPGPKASPVAFQSP